MDIETYFNISKPCLKELSCVFRYNRQNEEDEDERGLPWLAYFRDAQVNEDGLVFVPGKQRHVR